MSIPQSLKEINRYTGLIDFAETKNSSNIMLAVNYAHALKDISLIYGDAGLGKSYTLQHCARYDKDIIYIETRDCDKSTKGICERILNALGESKSGTDRILVDSIIEKLKGTNMLLIIDEAQHLNIKAIENLRAINNDAHVGIVLCGNKIVYDRMHGKGQAHFAQLSSRIGITRKVQVPTRQDIQNIFESEQLDKECLDFLHGISLKYGGLRNMIKVYRLGADIAKSNEESLTLSHLEESLLFKNGDK